MKRRSLLACILFTVIFVIPALPPVAIAVTLPATSQIHASVLDYYHAARTILYASLALSGVNVALTYHAWKKRE